ncbi:hypothetical protein [Nocardioides nitrophenolicus]|uniref:hypothetical protein n=1 Tax=Nocardioides nitrophenolicus TaxID=60489 RepID=UPI0019568FD5|nr:hypothetical protein [Nocardioides nitrophenolicus]MBM7517149.1 hypothetical protein [Nocardioides nitrophenolicus]
MGEQRADDTRPGDEASLAELYELVPATEDFDAPPTPGQAQGMVEHLLDGEVIDGVIDEAVEEPAEEPDEE